MKLTVGDTVRYLNAVGGGRVVRVEGDMAYVDEDGFETPVLCRECVVVAAPKSYTAAVAATLKKDSTSTPPPAPAPKPAAEPAAGIALADVPAAQREGGDSINAVLAFEASDIKTLSHADYDAYFVNDSNYWLFVTVAMRAASDTEWTPLYAGVVEPDIQEFLFTLGQSDLPAFDRLAVTVTPYKRDRAYAGRRPEYVEYKVDSSKFVKLHCFRANEYFDAPVIAFDILNANRRPEHVDVDAAVLADRMTAKAADRTPQPKRLSKSSKPSQELLEVDLHAAELFEGMERTMSKADILNGQIDYFCRIMDENRRNIGRKIVFIHGKGEGVLRAALMKELTHRYAGHDVQDASFAQYGFGATQVTIRSTANNPSPKGGKKKRP